MCSPNAKLIIELDGNQQLEQGEDDQESARYLQSQGYKVIHFWNKDVLKNIDSVILAIIQTLEENSNGD